MEKIKILEGAEEFSLGSGPVAVVLVHGFTGSPQGLRALGEFLAARGLAVVAPRLPGHGTTWQDLNSRNASEWTHMVEDTFLKAAAEHDEVFLVALSFGAALSLELATRYPDRVAGVVTLAGFVQTKDPRRFFAPVIKRIAKSLPGVGNDIADPDAEARELVYDRLPTRAAHEMLKTLKSARRALPAVRCPLLIMHGRGDHTVPPWNATVIHDTVSSEDKEVVWLDRSYHVITLDLDRDEVFERTHDFIKKRATNAF